MQMKQFNLVSLLLSVCLVVCLTLWILSEYKNNAYEKYLSSEIVNQIVGITSSTSYSLGILEDVLKSGMLTIAQKDELALNFSEIVFDIQDVANFAQYIGELKDFNYNKITIVNSDYYHYFMNLEIPFDRDRIRLSTEQIEDMTKMKNQMKEYIEVIEDTLHFTAEVGTRGQSNQFFDYYAEEGITDNYWVDLLKGYEASTKWSNRIY
ncbi:hypothetical protein [Salirhabdus sp. Marseille-P4669]|uniref:hypothetical protein n=1 Tax=Salirhabdus sp. Marseille-P4669 TaxID=2042310 RepID=UPI000C7D7739|nr:hypothetical protein [Salirhabdus sp. Marseille-P4669]